MPAGHEVEVVSRLNGLHAQLMSSAELTLWARVEGLDSGVVPRLLWDDKALVKTWAMRGTLHLLPSREYGTWQAAFSTYRHYLKPAWFRGFGISPDELEQLDGAVTKALDGRMLTRQELAAKVTALTRSPALGEKVVGSWGSLLKPSAFRGHLCFAPNAGQNVRFTGPASWIGPVVPALSGRSGPGTAADPDSSLQEIALRFLGVHGPATREDLARWWACSPAQAGRLLAAAGDEVVPVDVEGSAGWMLAGEVEAAAGARPSRTVRLLPAFDQFVVGATRHEENLLPGEFGARVYRPQGWLSPVVLVDGRMDGVWRHRRAGKRLTVEVEPFVKLPKWATRQVEDEAVRLAGYLGGTLDLTWAA